MRWKGRKLGGEDTHAVHELSCTKRLRFSIRFWAFVSFLDEELAQRISPRLRRCANAQELLCRVKLACMITI